MFSRKQHQVLLIALRVTAVIVGVGCVGYGGLVGVIGLWVDGPVPGGVRLLGLGVFLYGLLYCVPVWLIRRTGLVLAYGIATALPVLAVLSALVLSAGQATTTDLATGMGIFVPATCVPLVNAVLTYLPLRTQHSNTECPCGRGKI